MEEAQHHAAAGHAGLIERDEFPEEELVEQQVPEAVLAVANADQKQVKGLAADVIADATEWLMSDTDEDPEPRVTTRIITFRPGTRVSWKLRALEGHEFRTLRRMAMGSREQRRRLLKDGDPTAIDEGKYHALVVTTATVSPELEKVALAKGTHPVTIVEHRFRYIPGVLAELSGIVSDISGYDPDLIEEDVAAAVAGNS